MGQSRYTAYSPVRVCTLQPPIADLTSDDACSEDAVLADKDMRSKERLLPSNL